MEALGPADPVQVGPYRLVGRLGEGGMGRVFLARSPGGRPVAVKMVRPEYAGQGAREPPRPRGAAHQAAGPRAVPPGVAAARRAGPHRQLLGEGRESRRPGPGRTDPPAARSAHPRLVRSPPAGGHRDGAVQPVRPGRPPLPGAAGLCAVTASRAVERSGGQAQHRPADRRGAPDTPIAPLRGRAQRRPALHLDLSHFLGLDRRLPDTSSRDLARILWKSIDQFIAAAKDLEPIRHLSDAHARNVAKAFAEASAALYAAADVNVPDAGSVFDDHN
jgi:hypothetical protein